MNDNHCIFGGAVLFLLIPGLSMISWEQEDGMRIRRVDYRRCYVCTGSRRHVSSSGDWNGRYSFYIITT